MRIFYNNDGCVQFDNDADAQAYLDACASSADATPPVELTQDEINTLFGEDACFVGPHNTTVVNGNIIFDRSGLQSAFLAAFELCRDKLIQDQQWRIQRYESEQRQGLPLTEDISLVDAYIQALRDLPNSDGFDVANPAWPALPPEA